ncbi:MAG: hypothetical protein PQJ47_08820 [Sphaerochaetaceae bacterium]|nr:hypothetical protein [Sphaerochaetaceae bacterium]MDC7247076.1 hypothetical protein [Sphaerochaetaceae bacterium]
MKKISIIIVGILLIAGITGCVIGDDGDTYLAFSWVSKPLYFYDDNPSIPDTVYNGTYYRTDEGSFYMEYTAWDGTRWWMVYSISADSGSLLSSGDPAYFKISLYSFGPSVYKYSYPRQQVSDNSDPERPAVERITSGDYTLTIEYGPLQ